MTESITPEQAALYEKLIKERSEKQNKSTENESKAVLIINMPESCSKCPIGQNMSNAMEKCIHCPIINKCVTGEETEKRHDECPLSYGDRR